MLQIMPPEDLANDEWFRTHLHPHEPMLRAWLKSRYPSRNDIDDVIQEAYIRVLKAQNEGKVKSPKAFLFATARNRITDLARREKVVPIKEILTENTNSNVIDTEPDGFENLARNQELEILTKAVQQLPPRCRQIFILRKVYGVSQKEIAKKLGLSVNTVSAQLAIGLRKCANYAHVHWRIEKDQES